MSVELDLALAPVGTRFRLFAQARTLPAFSQPEVVVVSTPPGRIAPGPEDDRIFVVDAVNKIPYGDFGSLQPQQFGQRLPAVQPGPSGHFDHLDPDSREFASAAMYASVRRTLDIWQDYYGGVIPWVSRTSFPKLLLIPLVDWDNAQSGFGFLEFGYGRTDGGGTNYDDPHSLNFDVIAHEVGHGFLFTLVGSPSVGRRTPHFGAMHEGFADLTSIIAVLHFDTVVDHILQSSHGNLFTVNELSRVGEAANGREIRRAFNSFKLSNIGSTEPHRLSLPFTGAVFDILIDHFQRSLVSRGLITQQLADRSQYGRAPASELPAINAAFTSAYAGHEADFKATLLASRDYLGRLIARTWPTLEPNDLQFSDILVALLDADEALSNGSNAASIRDCFAWREIRHPATMENWMIHRLQDCGMQALMTEMPEHQRPGTGLECGTQYQAFVEGMS